jgi:hypothetical protein
MTGWAVAWYEARLGCLSHLKEMLYVKLAFRRRALEARGVSMTTPGPILVPPASLAW